MKRKQIIKVALSIMMALSIVNGTIFAAVTDEWDESFDYYGARLDWTRGQFANNTTYFVSGNGMNFNGNVALDDAMNIRGDANSNVGLASTSVPTFRYGYQQNIWKEKAWIQYSHGFSNITLDLSKDFAITGTLNVGSDFGKLDSSSEGAKTNRHFGDGNGVNIDGGVTISLIPENQTSLIMQDAKNGLSGAFRLGAYGVFRNSIVMEFDTSTVQGYGSTTGSPSDSFTIASSDGSKTYESEYGQTGDYSYEVQDIKNITGHNWYNTSFSNFKNNHSHVSSRAHVGISLTGRNGFVESENNATPRAIVGKNDSQETGLFNYRIEYKNGKLTFGLGKNANGWRYTTVTMNLPENYKNKRYQLATSFGAVYQNWTYYTDGTFFKNRITADQYDGTLGTGQIELTLQGVYTAPSLDNVASQVAFAKTDGSGSLGTENNQNGYVNAYSGGYVENGDSADEAMRKRRQFPVEGDTIIVQNNADVQSLFNGLNYAGNGQPITLKEITFKNVKFVDSSGTEISGTPPGLNTNASGLSIQYYYSTDGGSTWTKASKSNKNLNKSISDSNSPLRWRAVMRLPETTSVTNGTNTQFWLKGEVIVQLARSGNTITYNLPLYQQNNSRITFFSDPKDVGNNSLSKESARLISPGSNIKTLSGNGQGNSENSLSYGLYVKYNSTQTTKPYNPSWEGQDSTYSYKSISEIRNSSSENRNDSPDANVTLQEDTRYLVRYTMYDSQFNDSNGSTRFLPELAKNPDRAKSVTTRVIWNSDHVKIQNGYEFYLESKVEMTPEELDGFLTALDKGSYYRKIADKANVAVFQTANADWTNLANSSTISGNGNHTALTNAINHPGTPYDIPIQFKNGGVTIEKTVSVVVKDDTPKVVSDTGGNTIGDQPTEKVIFDGEDYTISASFKLVDANGNSVADDPDFSFDSIKDDIRVALYKQNGDIATNGRDSFYQWASGTEVGKGGKASASGPNKLKLPTEITNGFVYNDDGTFTVTFQLLNDDGSKSYNWIQQQWEDGANWRIYAWTDSNQPSKDYSNVKDSSTYKVPLDEKDSNVPSVTTNIQLIEKDNGNIPSSMFEISNVRLTEDPETNELINKDPKTTISVKRIDGADNTAKHDYYYTVEVADTKTDASKRPYVQLTQASTGRGLWATYLRYDPAKNSYTDVTIDNKEIGKISYNTVVVNNETINSSVRFGMRANILKNLSDKQDFTGNTSFTFTRYSIGGTGA